MKKLINAMNTEKAKLNKKADTMAGAIDIQKEVKDLTGESLSVHDAINHLSKVYAFRSL